jgi:hypothetical protein
VGNWDWVRERSSSSGAQALDDRGDRTMVYVGVDGRGIIGSLGFRDNLR